MYTPSRRLCAATAALASALFLAGCASDDDPIATPSEPVASASPTASAAPSVDEFCDAKVAIDAAFLAGGPPEDEGQTPTPEQIGEGIKASFSEPYAELKRTAQPEVASDVDTLVAGLDKAIADGTEDFFFDPAFAAADKKVDDFLSEECGFKKISGTAADYEFTGLPSVSPAGITGLTLTNEGEEFHEMILMHIDDSLEDESLEDIFQMEEEELGDKIMPMGVVLASPGTTATNFFDIKSGRYAILCFISEGSDAEHDFQGDGPPHFTKGMLEELKVLPGPGEATSEPTSSSSPSSSSGSSSTSSDDDEDETASPEPTSTS
jgi:hypothetical protein